MKTEMVNKQGCFANYCKNNRTKHDVAERVRAQWILTLIGVIIAALALIATIVVGVVTYNHRYDADASASGGITFTLSKKDTASGSFTASAGQITYGYFQDEGATPTKYTLSYKRNNDKYYTTLRTFTVYGNDNYAGSYNFQNNKYSQRYDVKCVKKSNINSKTVLEFDWGIE